MNIKISHYGKKGFKEHKHPYWVFIRGAESSWSLNDRERRGANWWTGEIPEGTLVTDWQGKKRTAGDILAGALEEARRRGHVVFDHEDAGFKVDPHVRVYQIEKLKEDENLLVK